MFLLGNPRERICDFAYYAECHIQNKLRCSRKSHCRWAGINLDGLEMLRRRSNPHHFALSSSPYHVPLCLGKRNVSRLVAYSCPAVHAIRV